MAKTIFLVDTCNRCTIFSFFSEAKMVFICEKYLSVERLKVKFIYSRPEYYAYTTLVPNEDLLTVSMLQIGEQYVIYTNSGNKNSCQ